MSFLTGQTFKYGPQEKSTFKQDNLEFFIISRIQIIYRFEWFGQGLVVD